MVHFDPILTRIGQFKQYQIYNFILIGLAGVPIGMHSMANVFLAGMPNHACKVPELTNHSISDTYHLSAPLIPCQDGQCYDKCTYYDINYTSFSGNIDLHDNGASPNVNFYRNHSIYKNASIKRCNDWLFADNVFEKTIVTEYRLVCSDLWMKSLAQSLYMLGFMLGAVCTGTLSDRIGRLKAWFMCLCSLVITGSIAAFLPNYIGHVFMRFLSGIAAAGCFTIGFVMTVEIIGPDYRMKPGIFYQGWFAAGYMILPVLAYFIRDFQYLQLTISLIPALFIPYIFILNESPRWLLAQRKMEKAETLIRKMADMNRREYPEEMLLQNPKDKQQEEEHTHHRTYTVIDLLRTPNLRMITLNVFFNWFVNSFVYYGLSLGVQNLPGGPYLNLFISGAVEFPSFVIAIMMVDRIGRRWPLAGMLIVGGICCLLTPFIPEHLEIFKTVLAMLGKLSISGSFALIYVFSAELFPTVVRNTGVGSGSMCARIGGLTAPFVADLSLYWKALPFFIFGFCSLVAGLLSFLLPETLHKDLPETLEDGEHFARSHLPCNRHLRKKEESHENEMT